MNVRDAHSHLGSIPLEIHSEGTDAATAPTGTHPPPHSTLTPITVYTFAFPGKSTSSTRLYNTKALLGVD